MKQIFLTLELLDYDLDKFPIPTIPKVIYKSHRLFFSDNSDPIELTKLIASKCGLEEANYEKDSNN